MLKIVIFDSGWGGELLADVVKRELPVVEVITVIDWRNAPYTCQTPYCIKHFTERALKSFIGHSDLIILGSFTASIALSYLRSRHPNQNFLAMNIQNVTLPKCALHRVLILASNNTQHQSDFCHLLNRLSNQQVFLPECDIWETYINDGTLTPDLIQEDLEPFIGHRIDTVIIASTYLWDLESTIADILGYQVQIVDTRQQFKRDLHRALKL